MLFYKLIVMRKIILLLRKKRGDYHQNPDLDLGRNKV